MRDYYCSVKMFWLIEMAHFDIYIHSNSIKWVYCECYWKQLSLKRSDLDIKTGDINFCPLLCDDAISIIRTI